MEQLRYNSGKPQLTYLFAHGRALSEIQYPLEGSPETLYQDVQRELVQFLSGGPRSHLARAVGGARMALEYELGGEPIERVDGQPICDLADAAFCAVCVYGESKYARGNFRKGAPVTQYLDCALRHLRKIFRAQALDSREPEYKFGVCKDSESGEAHGAHVYWNLLEALEQPDWRDDRLPPVNGGEYDLKPQAVEVCEDPGYSFGSLQDEKLVTLASNLLGLAEDEHSYYASYEPDCGCGMCEELRPEMVEVEFTVRADEVVYLQFGLLGWGQP